MLSIINWYKNLDSKNRYEFDDIVAFLDDIYASELKQNLRLINLNRNGLWLTMQDLEFLEDK